MTTSQQATRAAIVAAVRAFVYRVDERARRNLVIGGYAQKLDYGAALRDELLALERTVAAEGEGETA